ncbi:MAG: T9SS type A sorting domain-containing protein, partial [Bacteroidota bacterium]
LGIYPDLPGNTSWRFVDKTFVFEHPSNPFQDNFPENRNIASFTGSTVGEDFVSIKIGDVNGTAIPNALTQAEVRSDRAASFLMEETELKTDHEKLIRIKATEALDGFQFTLIFKDLDILSIEPGVGMQADQFALFPERSALTVSWNGTGTPDFALRVRVRAQAPLHELIALSSSITRAEAYETATGGTPQPVQFIFNGSAGTTVSKAGFELFQNQPNPFVHKTSIGFYLPEPGRATLSVTDPSGKTVYTQQADFEKGYQRFKLDRNALGSAGIWFYTVQTPFGTESRKMSLTAKE